MRVTDLLKAGAALGLAALMAGCGFTPIYAERGDALRASLSAIAIQPIESDREYQSGYHLEQELGRLLGSEKAGAQYSLQIDLREDRSTEAITRRADNVRFNLSLSAAYTLSDADGEVIHTGRKKATSNYSAAPSLYATEVAEQNAMELAARSLAREIELDLSLYFNGMAENLP